MAKEQERWTEEGGSLPSDMVVTVTKSRFGTDDKYAGGDALVLKWNCEVESCDVDLEDPEDYVIFFSCGKDWDTEDGGKTAYHDKRKGFVGPGKDGKGGSAVGRLVDKCTLDLDMADLLQERAGVVGQGAQLHAKIWEGLKLHLKRETFPSDFGDRKEVSVLLPVELLEDGTGGKSKKAKSKDDDDDKPAKKKAKGGGDFDAAEWVEAADEGLIKKLRKAAGKADSADEFVDYAMDIDDVDEDKTIRTAIVENSKALYKELS